MGALGSRTSGWAEGGQGWEQGTGTHTEGDRQTGRTDGRPPSPLAKSQQ